MSGDIDEPNSRQIPFALDQAQPDESADIHSLNSFIDKVDVPSPLERYFG
jgi:hypothetical protein